MYVGGYFFNAGGNDSADRIARWDAGDLAPAWNALGAGLNGVVRAIAIAGPNVYVGGDFTNAGGNDSADYIARWDGRTWHNLGAGIHNTVYAIAVAGPNVYVAGTFSYVNGDPNANYIARWDGSAWHALGTGA